MIWFVLYTSIYFIAVAVEGVFQSYQNFVDACQYAHAAAKAKTAVRLLPNALCCKIMLVQSLMHTKPRDALHLAQKYELHCG